MPSTAEEPFEQFRLRFTDKIQERYEVARPPILGLPVSIAQRARETGIHPQTIRNYVRRFQRDGMFGLDDGRAGVAKAHTIPDAVRQEVIRLKTLYPPLHHREIANIIYAKMECPISYKSVQRILKAHPIPVQHRLPFPKFRDFKEPYQARVEVVKLYYQGWNIKSISGFLGVSRKHIYTLLERFEEEAFAGLMERSHAPHHPRRKLYLLALKKIADLQRQYPYLGRFRIWGLLKREGITDLGESTVGAAMAFNRFVYTELSREQPQKPPRPHPFKSRTRHQYWFVDHRYLIKIDGIQYYSLAILEGYSRAFLSGLVVATTARGPFLKLLYETIALWGAPAGIVSDSGSAFISEDYQRVCQRLDIVPHHIESGQSWQNLIESHFTIQKRMADTQFERAGSERVLQALHMQFMDVYNTTDHLAHQKRKDGRRTPQEVLSWVRGNIASGQQLSSAFREHLWTRTTDLAGYVTVQNYYLYAERALNRKRVCLWLWDDTLKVDYRDELLASYPCVYDVKEQKITDIREPTLHPNRYGAGQPLLIELSPEQWQRVSRRAARQRRTRYPGAKSSQLILPETAVGM